MKPTHRLKILDKGNDNRGVVGAGWENEDGSITIVLELAIVLDYENLQDKILTLFPINRD